LSDRISAVHEGPHGTYGALRVQAELVHGQGVVVGHNTVALLMRRAGISGLPLRRKAKKVGAAITVTDLVRREFRREGPNQLWVTDITEHPTREGKVYCCVVIDTFSRRVVGWAIDSRARADLATNALGMAIDSRSDPSGQIPGGVIHGDQGTQGGFNRSSQHLDRGGVHVQACKSKSSIAAAGIHASNSPTQSSNTSRAFITAAADTLPSAGPHP
jgi:putative transposase